MTDTMKTNGQRTIADYEQELRQLRQLAAAANSAPLDPEAQARAKPIGPNEIGRHTVSGSDAADDDDMPLPQPVISESLVENAPAQMPQIVRSMHHTAAQALDDAATHLEQEMQSHIALMREAAGELRVQGDSQALTIEALSTLIRDTHGAFKQQADRLARFRSGQPDDISGA